MDQKQTVLQVIRLTSLSARTGMCVGFGIGLLVLVFGSRMNPWMVLSLCPTSIVGLGLENAPFVVGIVVGGSVILIGNAIWYAWLFGLIGVLLEKITPDR